MKKTILLLLLFYSRVLYSQVISVNDFITLASLPDKKINSYIAKMGFVQVAKTLDDGRIVNEFFYRNKKQPFDTVARFLSGYRNGPVTGVSYQTSSFAEYYSILKEFRMNGFTTGKEKTDSTARTDSAMLADSLRMDSASFFQKEDMTVKVGEEVRDELKMFRILLEKKPPPASSSLRFADDLLFFDSHEALVTKFGEANVRKDMYYFSDTDSIRCSVIFPDTKRQAIFIWDDQANSRTLSYLMIGGTLHAGNTDRFDQTISLSTWQSNSGLYTGMRLAEIVRVNQGDFNFFGKASEFAFMAVPEKKGNIDFKKTGIVLGCLNCTGVAMLKTEKVSAEAAVAAGLQLYILSIVFVP